MKFDVTGLRPHQCEHAARLYQIMARTNRALDGSDTGIGKTYAALAVARALGLVPFVVGPKNAQAGWEEAAARMGTPLEYVNYEKIRSVRRWRSGVQVDRVELSPTGKIESPWSICGFWNGRRRLKKEGVWSEILKILADVEHPWPTDKLPEVRILQADFDPPVFINKQKTAESDWIVEKPYGKGSFLQWKRNYALMIFDEVHRCGGDTSLNSKLLIAAQRQAGHILALSATAAEDPRQMKAIGFMLGLHNLGKSTPDLPDFRTWLFRYGCEPGIFGGMEFVGDDEEQDKTIKKLHRQIYPERGARLRKADVPGFPKTQIEVKLLPFESEAERLSEELHQHYQTRMNQAADVPALEEEIRLRQALEILKIPYWVDMALDYSRTSKLCFFVNYRDTVDLLTDELRKHLVSVEFLDGRVTGGLRNEITVNFQKNKIDAVVVNSTAGGESINLHDPNGKVERTSLISPVTSGKLLKQIFGRPHRDGGAFSLQLLTGFKDTREETMLERVARRLANIDLLNDGDLRL